MAKPKKKAEKFVKLQIPAMQANPSPPVGPALGQAGVNIMEFCNQFNDTCKKEQLEAGAPIPVVISVYKDKSFTFIAKKPPVSYYLKKAANLKKGSGEPNRSKVGSLTWDQVREIAEIKMPDLNAFKVESAMKMVAGTARSMGITVKGTAPWE